MRELRDHHPNWVFEVHTRYTIPGWEVKVELGSKWDKEMAKSLTPFEPICTEGNVSKGSEDDSNGETELHVNPHYEVSPNKDAGVHDEVMR